MIFYFSGTGNSQWVAGQIASLIGDETRDVTKISTPPDVTGEKQVGFVFPIYAWGVPEPMMNFVKTLKQTDAFSFAVCTCGEEAGLAMKKLGKCYPLRSCYSLVMPNNYVIGSDVDDLAAASQKIKKAKQALVTMARQIREQQPVYEVTEGPLPGLKSGVVNFGFNRFARRTDLFCDGRLYQLWIVRTKLPSPYHYAAKRAAGLGQSVLPVFALYQCMPAKGYSVR